MKKFLFLLVLIIAVVFTTCEDLSNPGEETYKITFDANGGEGGPASVMAKYNRQMPPLTEPAPTQGGYSFTGYYDAQTAGTMYYAADLSSAKNWDRKENATLFAQWSANSYAITFNDNGGTGGQTAQVMAIYNQAMPTLTGPAPARTDYYFSGYYDAPSGGTMYYRNDLQPAKEYWDKKGNATLYAQWTLIPNITITFRSNDGSNQTATQSIPENTEENLRTNTFTRTGYTFNGWATTQTGTVEYADGAKYSAGTANADLYAVWAANNYSITFDANGGSGGQATPVTAVYDQPMPALAGPAPSNGDLSFAGYFDLQTGGTKYYNTDLSSARNWDKAASTLLYAQWRVPSAVPGNSSVVSLVRSSAASITAATPYADIKALVAEAVEFAGGLDDIIKSGDVVALKPNILHTGWSWGTGTGNYPATNGTGLPNRLNGVCTDMYVLRAVSELVREIIGPYNSATGRGKIMVLEGSCTGSSMTPHYNHIGFTTANVPEVNEFIDLGSEGAYAAGNGASAGNAPYNTRVNLTDFKYKNVPTGSYSGASPYRTYYGNNGTGDGVYYVNKKMFDADAIISLPVLKTHNAVGVTGGIKNISIGAAPPTIYGVSASSMARNGMVNHSSINLHEWIADFFSCLPADFVIMDALVGLQGGPGGYGNQAALNNASKYLRCMLASKDPLALDITETNIENWNYTTLPYITYLGEKGQVGGKTNGRVIPLRGDTKDIVVLGNIKVDDIRSTFTGTASAGGGRQLNAAELTKPTVSITSAAFSDSNLYLILNLSNGTNDAVVKVDIYIDGQYAGSVNEDMDDIIFPAASLAGGSHTIEVRAYTKFMFCATAAATAAK